MHKSILIIMSVMLVSAGLYGYDDYFEEITENFEVSGDRPLEVILDVDAGEVLVDRSDNALKGSLQMKFNSDQYRTKIDYDQDKNRLFIRLDKRSWYKWSNNSDDENYSYCHLSLPFKAVLLLDTRVKAGEVTLKLGGLSIQEFSLNNWAGEVRVSFDEPNLTVMDFMDIDARIGEVQLLRLGNARFLKADINGGIGELYAEFTGLFETDSRAKVDLDIGEASIVLPENLAIRMHVGGSFGFLSHKDIDHSLYKRGRYYYSEDYDEHDQRLSLRISTGLGELRIDRE